MKSMEAPGATMVAVKSMAPGKFTTSMELMLRSACPLLVMRKERELSSPISVAGNCVPSNRRGELSPLVIATAKVRPPERASSGSAGGGVLVPIPETLKV